jgi:hypothetical protein
MRKFKVLSSRIIGINGKQFQLGSQILESDLRPGVVPIYLSRGRIQEITDYSIKEGEKIKLAIVTSVWKRPEVFSKFIHGVNRLINSCDQFEIFLIVSGSIQSDKSFISQKQLIESNGLDLGYFCSKYFKYIEIPNEPLAAKVNATTYACRNLNVHYVLCMGSDDIISPELLNEYAKHMRKGIDFIGVTDCYFYDTVSKKALYWGGYREAYRKGHTCGAFRALSARLLSQWDWMPWENKDSLVLDKSMQDKLKITPHTFYSFSMKEKGLFGLDIKSSTNMTPFALWDNSEYIDPEIIKKQFGYLFE